MIKPKRLLADLIAVNPAEPSASGWPVSTARMKKAALHSPVAWKLALVAALALSIATTMLLAAPSPIARTAGLEAFRETNRARLGMVLVAGGSLFLAGVGLWCVMQVVDAAGSRRVSQGLEFHLRQLTAKEKGHLKPYLVAKDASLSFAIDDGVAHGLVGKGIIYPAGGMATLRTEKQPYNIQPWALRYLKKNRSLLEGAEGAPVIPDEFSRL